MNSAFDAPQNCQYLAGFTPAVCHNNLHKNFTVVAGLSTVLKFLKFYKLS